MNTTRPTVFIVDDDPSICRSLSRVVRQAGLDALTFPSAEAFLHTRGQPLQHPACAILDLQMPGLNGLELQRALASHPSSCPVIFISGNATIPASVQAMRQGAVTFLTKPFDTADLLHAIHEALAHHRARLQHEALVHRVTTKIDSLTAREREVMAWVITGALNKQIAAELGIVEKTVKVHRARVLEKMQATSVADLVRLCSLAGIPAARQSSG